MNLDSDKRELNQLLDPIEPILHPPSRKANPVSGRCQANHFEEGGDVGYSLIFLLT